MTCSAPDHGTLDAYKHKGCRCPAARAANSRWMKSYRLSQLRGEQRAVDATGTRRRIQALSANGWGLRDLAPYFGCSASAVSCLQRSRTVFARTAARTRRVYEQLADQPGPSPRAAAHARNRGWLPPIWWDDDLIDDPRYTPPIRPDRRSRSDIDQVVVDRLIAGDPVDRPTATERLHAYIQLRARGLTRTAAGEWLGMSGTRVVELERRANADSTVEAAA